MVEATIDDNLPPPLLIVFGISTTLVVVIHLMALMVSTCMYPDIEAVANSNRIDVSTAEYVCILEVILEENLTIIPV